MTENLWAAPAPGAPFTSRSLAHLQLAETARELSDWARHLVPAGRRPDQAYDGTLVADAAALVELAGRVLTAAVLVEREDGCAWSAIAEVLDVEEEDVRQRWEPITDAWAQEQPGCSPDAAAQETSTAEQLRDLDAWMVGHRDPADPDLGPTPVSSVMERQHPLLELVHLRELEGCRAEEFGAASAERRAVVERQIHVHQTLIGRASTGEQDRNEHRAQVTRLRRLVGELWAAPGDGRRCSGA